MSAEVGTYLVLKYLYGQLKHIPFRALKLLDWPWARSEYIDNREDSEMYELGKH